MAWAMRGRSALLADLRDRVTDGDSVVLAGSAGVGKTTLAREAARELDARWVVGSPALAPIPLGAVAHLLDGDAEITLDDPLAALRSVASVVEGTGAELIVVDDLPLLDQRSLGLVQHLVRRRRVPVVATVRDRSAVDYAVRVLWQEDGMSVLDVGPLAVEDVGEVLSAVLEGEVDHSLAPRLHALTGGNALVLREAVESGVADGSLELVDGSWTWSGVRQPSSGLIDAVRARLAATGDVGVVAGDLLALGEPVPVDALVRLAGANAVEALESSGVMTVDAGDGAARFAHPLYGEVIAASLGVARRRRLWADLADAVEPTARTATDVLRVARWRLGGGGSWGQERWVDAAETANARFDHELAEALARRARGDGGGWRASLALASALVGLGRLDDAHHVLAEMGDRATDDDERMAYAVALYHARTAGEGPRLEFAADLQRVEEEMDDPDNRRFVAAQRATLLCFAGDLVGGARLIDDLLDELGDREDPAAIAVRLRLAVPLGTAAVLTGRTRAAADYCSSHLALSLGLTDRVPAGPVWCATTLMHALVAGGWLAEADTGIELLRSVLDGGDWSDWFREQAEEFLTTIGGSLAMTRGLAPAAVEALRAQLGLGLDDVLALHRLGEAAAVVGDVELAEQTAQRLDEIGRRSGSFAEIGALGQVWADAARGAVDVAAVRAVEATTTAVEAGRGTVASYLAHAAVRLGRPKEVLPLLESLASTCDLVALPLMVDHARAAATNDGDGLDAVAGRFTEAGFLLLAAEAHDHARLAHLGAGRPRDADRSAAASATLIDRCGGVRPPWLGIVGSATPLTRRETEVVQLAARGLTSSAIAERLFVSTRTVEGHLLRAYQKLGVRSRDELARLVDWSDADQATPAP